LRSMVNICEPLINVVICDKPKALTWLPKEAHRLGPKGKGPGMGAPNSPIADVAPPAERRNLTYAGTCTERGKPVGLPVDTSTRESLPQGKPMGLRVGDGGRSECLPVMGRIGVEPGDCAVRTDKGVHHSTRKRADFPIWSLITREFGEPSQEGKHKTAGIVLAGALSCAAKTGTYKLDKRSGAAQGGSKRVS